MTQHAPLPKKALITAAAVLLFLLLCLYEYATDGWDALFEQTGLAPSVDETCLTVTVPDVGDADCCILRLGEHALMIDAGSADTGDTVCRYLKTHRIRRLDYLIATHAHEDHIGGMEAVLRTVPVERFLYAPSPELFASDYGRRLQNTLTEYRVPQIAVTGEMDLTLGTAAIHLFPPLDDTTDENNRSVICRAVYGNRAFLFAGDAGPQAETALTDNGERLKADFLKVSHHGSRDTAGEAFFRAVSPHYAVITCSGTVSGHPHPQTLLTLKKLNIPVYRTDRHGTVTVTSDGTSLTVETDKEEP